MNQTQDVYCSTTDFKANLKHYKELAKSCVVHVTEHGRADSVLLSLEMLERRKAEACHRAKWQVWAEHACFRGVHGNLGGGAMPQTDIEYLGRPWEGHVAPSFADDIRARELSERDVLIVKGCLSRLAVNPHAGRPIDVGPEAYLPSGITACRLNAAAFDIIYGLSTDDDVQVYGLIPALKAAEA